MTKVHDSFKLISKAVNHKTNADIKIEMPAIYETTNYELIQFCKVNRLTTMIAIVAMGNSLIELGKNLRDIIVGKIGNNYYYIDGQHLAKSLIKLNLPLRFKLIYLNDEEQALKFITKMNSTARTFTFKQYIESYSQTNKDFLYLKELNKKTGVSFTTLGIALTSQSMQSVKTSIKNGTFKITEKKMAIARVDAIIRFYQMTGIEISQYCTHGLIDFIKNLPNGLADYIDNEVKFLYIVTNTNIVPKIPLGKRESYIKLFSECWNNAKSKNLLTA